MRLTTHFQLQEFACNDSARTPVPAEYIPNAKRIAENLQVLRDHLGEPITINSAYRTPAYNKSINGAKNSQHLTANAADIRVRSKTPKQLAAIVEKLIAEKKLAIKGLGVYANFIHVDLRSRRTRWVG